MWLRLTKVANEKLQMKKTDRITNGFYSRLNCFRVYVVMLLTYFTGKLNVYGCTVRIFKKKRLFT